jgi:hypothetical protein
MSLLYRLRSVAAAAVFGPGLTFLFWVSGSKALSHKDLPVYFMVAVPMLVLLCWIAVIRSFFFDRVIRFEFEKNVLSFVKRDLVAATHKVDLTSIDFLCVREIARKRIDMGVDSRANAIVAYLLTAVTRAGDRMCLIETTDKETVDKVVSIIGANTDPSITVHHRASDN